MTEVTTVSNLVVPSDRSGVSIRRRQSTAEGLDGDPLFVGQAQKLQPVQKAFPVAHDRADLKRCRAVGQAELQRDDFTLQAFGGEYRAYAAVPNVTTPALQLLVARLAQDFGFEGKIRAVSFMAPPPAFLLGVERFFKGRRAHRNGQIRAMKELFGYGENLGISGRSAPNIQNIDPDC